MDEWLYMQWQPAPIHTCPIHSETPGMMIDRLSILALKAFHMDIQVQRTDAEPLHRERCLEKFITIKQQHQQLSNCFDDLITDIHEKKRTFRVYHQFKMYNDPTLNPQLYEKG